MIIMLCNEIKWILEPSGIMIELRSLYIVCLNTVQECPTFQALAETSQHDQVECRRSTTQ